MKLGIGSLALPERGNKSSSDIEALFPNPKLLNPEFPNPDSDRGFCIIEPAATPAMPTAPPAIAKDPPTEGLVKPAESSDMSKSAKFPKPSKSSKSSMKSMLPSERLSGEVTFD